MTRQLLILAGGLSLAFSAGAELISPEQALRRAEGSGMMKLSSVSRYSKVPAYTAYTSANDASAYVFAKEGAPGFIIVSADDSAVPMLGYSDSNQIDVNNLPPQLEWWLGEYSKEIEYARTKGAGIYKGQEWLDEWKEVAPMIKSKWNQDAPYYDECPKMNGRNTYTGCVATAMAQVMNYFQYPDRGTGRSRYMCEGLGRLEMNFSDEAFQWNKMLDVYSDGNYTKDQAYAVAYLMKACGYSVEMYYGTNMSGAVSAEISGALKDHFKYDGNVRYEQRLKYSASEWNKMVYENLRDVGPIIYNGNSSAGGHSFVCDGYDGNGYFHFNWGWGGTADGYFMLNALSPHTQGIGGYEGGYNQSQDAVFGIQKPTGNPVVEQQYEVVQYGALEGSLKGNEITFTFTNWTPLGLGNYGGDPFKCYIGGIFESVDGTGESIVEKMSNYNVLSMQIGGYYPVSSGFMPKLKVPADLPDGKYKVTLASKVSTDENAAWIPVVPPYGYPNYVYIEKNGDTLELTNEAISSLEVKSVEIVSDCYYGYPLKVALHISNPTDKELTQSISIILSHDGKDAFVGESKMFTLKAGESYDDEWVVSFTEQKGSTIPKVGESVEYTVSAYNGMLNQTYGDYGNIEMTRLRTKNNFRSRGLEILNSESEYDEQLGVVYNVTNPEKIELMQSVEVVTGYFAYPMIARIYRQDDSSSSYLVLEQEQSFGDIEFLKSGELKDFSTTLHFADAEKDKIYFLRTYYVEKNRNRELAEIKFKVDTSGVESVAAESGLSVAYDKACQTAEIYSGSQIVSVEVVDINGSGIPAAVELSGNHATVDFNGCGTMIALLRVANADGDTKVVKVAL